MLKSQVPYYNDSADFESNPNVTYPCDTQYMQYNPLLHRYYLTPDGLNKHGIDAERMYVSTSSNKIQELIELTSKKVYDYIQYKAGRRNYEVQMYRIATAPKTIYPSQYIMRKQFEEALAEQARYIVNNGDSAKYSNYNMEAPTPKQYIDPAVDLRDNFDIAPETIRTLEVLGLTKWFTLANMGMTLNPDKF